MTHDEQERVKAFLMEGWTTPRIARETLISEYRIRNFIKGTPFYDIARENWRNDLRLRLAKKRGKTCNCSRMTREDRGRIENLLLDGLTMAQVAQETGISDHRIFALICNTVYMNIARKNLQRWREKYGRNYLVNQRDVNSRNHFLKKPKYIWTRYYVLVCGFGLMLVDRMHERFSTERYWMEFSIKEYRAEEATKARREARELNREWHEWVREHYGVKRK